MAPPPSFKPSESSRRRCRRCLPPPLLSAGSGFDISGPGSVLQAVGVLGVTGAHAAHRPPPPDLAISGILLSAPRMHACMRSVTPRSPCIPLLTGQPPYTSLPPACLPTCPAVGIHEAGHFYAAVSRGIHVSKFAIGFGPTLLKWQARVRGGPSPHPLWSSNACLCKPLKRAAGVVRPTACPGTKRAYLLYCCTAGQGGGVLAAPAAARRLCRLPRR